MIRVRRTRLTESVVVLTSQNHVRTRTPQQRKRCVKQEHQSQDQSATGHSRHPFCIQIVCTHLVFWQGRSSEIFVNFDEKGDSGRVNF